MWLQNLFFLFFQKCEQYMCSTTTDQIYTYLVCSGKRLPHKIYNLNTVLRILDKLGIIIAESSTDEMFRSKNTIKYSFKIICLWP